MPLTVIIASYLEPQHITRIETQFPDISLIYRPDLLGQPRYIADHTAPVTRTTQQEAEWQALLAEADVLFDFDYSHRADLPDLAPKLRWIQATSAGIGQFVKRMAYAQKTDWVFTTASGVHARPLAEFALMGMLMFAKNYTRLFEDKENRVWNRYCGTDLTGKTATVIGLGSIGQEVARLAKAFEMRVIGNRRDPQQPVPYVDQLYGTDDLHAMLPQTDFLVLSTPHTPETENLIGQTEINLLPQGAVIINVARGVVIDEPAMIDALERGHLAGAVLDVFREEPLPQDNPLWAMPNVIVSPHSASTVASENDKIVDIFCENLTRFQQGEPLINQLDVDKLY
ncbi:MAG: D-2-hydroxyacid dehydrogenase [Anaerolineae bacterium]